LGDGDFLRSPQKVTVPFVRTPHKRDRATEESKKISGIGAIFQIGP
jgi:hypothetical protein